MVMLALLSNGVFALHAYRASGGMITSGNAGRKLSSTGVASSHSRPILLGSDLEGLSARKETLEENNQCMFHIQYHCLYRVFVC